jgi:uncharacterized protein involved in oxidation of intracellular sulfur
MKVNIFLLGDAVSSAKKGQKTPEGYYNLQQMLRDLIEQRVEVIACGTCVSARGLTKEELLEGVQVGTMMHLAQWIKESQKILSI